MFESMHFCLPIWGEKYIDEFMEFSFATQLSPNNLPSFELHSPAIKFIYHVYTTASGIDYLMNSNFGKLMPSFIEIKFHSLESILTKSHLDISDKYNILSRVHEECLEEAKNVAGGIAFLCSDMVVSNGTFKTCFNALLQGKKAVLVAPVRVNFEDIQACLEAEKSNEIISITGSKLTTYMFQCLNIEEINYNVYSGNYSTWNFFLSWISNNVMIKRGFSYIPIFSVPNSNSSLNGETYDVSEYVDDICDSFENDAFIISDSNDALILGLTEKDYFKPEQFPENQYDPLTTCTNIINSPYFKNWHYKLIDYPVKFYVEDNEYVKRLEKASAVDTDTFKSLFKLYNENIHFKEYYNSSDVKDYLKICWIRISEVIDVIGDKPVVLYGAGVHSEKLLSHPKVSLLNIKAISDSNTQVWGESIDHFSIISPDEILDYAKDVIISSKFYESEIHSFLTTKFGENLTVHKLYS